MSEATHNHGDVLDLIFTDVPDTVEVCVNDSIGTLDHNALALRIKINQPVFPVVTDRVVYLKNRVEWTVIRKDVLEIPWRTIYNAVCSVTALNSVLDGIIVRKLLTRTIKVSTQSKP